MHRHPTSRETKRVPSATGLATIIAVATFTGCATSLAQDASPPTATFELNATQTEIDEGEIVEFEITNKEYRHPTTGEILRFEADLSPVAWDFDDDQIDTPEAYGLYNFKHGFNSDRDSPYVVKATHQGTTEEVRISVRNVLPEITNISVTEEPLTGEPVVFQAVGRDPGFTDELTYEWNLGDGTTASGPNVIHTYASAGSYEVTLSVADEQGRDSEDDAVASSFVVVVEDELETPTPNTMSVSGDFSAAEAPITSVTLVGSNGNPVNPEAGGACQIRMEMRTDRDDMLLTLTARLDPGLGTGYYTIGRSTEWDGMIEDDRAAQGTFFADFAPPSSEAVRVIDGLRISGPFWSERGRVAITRFDSGVLDLEFLALLTENVPARFDARQVTVWGAVSMAVGSASAASSGERAIDAVRALDDLLGTSGRGTAGLSTYLCPGEEPGEFEVVAANPSENAVNARYEDNAITVEFSQAIDSDSIVNPDSLDDNLGLYFRTVDGERAYLKGGWVISPRNPKEVVFIPQSRIVPGVIHCVEIFGGEDGLRSFSGSILAGSQLEAPSEAMAPACDTPGENQFGFSFSTQVELQSIWVDVYDSSLIGPHVSSALANGENLPVRVHTWWQDSLTIIHSNSQVREFPANVFGVANQGPLDDPRTSRPASPVSTVIRRPDLYSEAQIRDMEHTVQFELDSSTIGDVANVFAVIQLKTKDGIPIEPVIPGVVSRMNPELNPERFVPFSFVQYPVEGICPDGYTQEQCGWAGPWDESWLRDLRTSDRASDIYLDTQFPGRPGRRNFDTYPFNVISGSVDPIAKTPQDLALEIFQEYIDEPDYAPWVSVVVAYVPPGFLPENEPVALFRNEFPRPHVLIMQVDRINVVAQAKDFVRLLLGDEACLFEGRSFCDFTPVQGMSKRRGALENASNKHHAEVNRLVPLLTPVPYDDYNEADFHISAYNYAKLLEAFGRRREFVDRYESND